MLWDSFSILMSLLSHSVCGKALHVCISFLYCRSHRLPVHLGLTACYVILTGLRCSLVLAVLSGNFWVWISLGVGVGSGYLLIRPCFISATSEVSDEEDINGQGRVRLKTVRKTGHYSIPKTGRHSQSVPESTQIEYYIQTTENNNNNNNNHSTDDTDKQQGVHIVIINYKGVRHCTINWCTFTAKKVSTCFVNFSREVGLKGKWKFFDDLYEFINFFFLKIVS